MQDTERPGTRQDRTGEQGRAEEHAQARREQLRRRYREERDKRLRPDGNDQYIRVADRFPVYLEDPYTPFKEREPIRHHCRVLFVGGGFAGLLTAARLREAGIEDVWILDKAGDFGGTWYWNRYPGAQCDTSSFVYMPLLEETGHMPSEKYAHAPEILAHCRRIGERYDLYRTALFHTQVTGMRWEEEQHRWLISTNRGDQLSADFVGLGTGPLHVPKLPGLEGIETFTGTSFHTSRWDYDYTGGDPEGAPMLGLAGKRVALIGTGATSVQCVPRLAEACGQLLVFQRTPSSVDVRDNAPTDETWFKEMATPGWQQRWLDNFTANQTGVEIDQDLVMDGWTDLSRRAWGALRQLGRPPESAEELNQVLEDSDFEKMNEIRARVDALVADPATAAALKPWYRQLCKRPCFHDEYLQAFNNPNVSLVDTDGQGVERITAQGVVAGGREYQVDCIIYASGFEVGTDLAGRVGFDPVGSGGVTLSEHWAEGMRTLHGLYSYGFPNLFVVQLPQGANLLSNVPHNLSESARTITAVVTHAREVGAARVEVEAQAEQAWIELLAQAPPRRIGGPDCTPGYYNNEGRPPDASQSLSVGYPEGAHAFFRFIQQWRESGDFDGLQFT